MWCIRRVLGITHLDRVTNVVAKTRADLPTLESQIVKCRLRFFGKIKRIFAIRFADPPLQCAAAFSVPPADPVGTRCVHTWVCEIRNNLHFLREALATHAAVDIDQAGLVRLAGDAGLWQGATGILDNVRTTAAEHKRAIRYSGDEALGYACDACCGVFPTDFGRKIHLAVVHGIRDPAILATKARRERQKQAVIDSFCRKCAVTLADIAHAKMHFTKKHDEEWMWADSVAYTVCPRDGCVVKCKGLCSLMNHLSGDHKNRRNAELRAKQGPERFGCTKCANTYAFKCGKERHMRTKHPELYNDVRHYCPNAHCIAFFPSTKGVFQHLKTCWRVDPTAAPPAAPGVLQDDGNLHVCYLCKKEFTRKKQYLEHRALRQKYSHAHYQA